MSQREKMSASNKEKNIEKSGKFYVTHSQRFKFAAKKLDGLRFSRDRGNICRKQVGKREIDTRICF